MEPGERIDTIRRSATALAKLDWPEVDLVLRQFGFPTSDAWGGADQYGYALHHLERGSDQVLRDLVSYLAPTAEHPTEDESAVARLWGGKDRFRLFTSHSSRDKVPVSQVRESLSRFGISAFVAHVDIEPTKEWVGEIEHALNTCQALAAFLAPGFHESKWTDQEIGYCVKRRVLIVPVRMGLDPYGFIGRYQALEGGGQPAAEIAKRLVELLVAHELTGLGVAQALVARLETAANYDSAKATMALLRKVPKWTSDLLSRLEGVLNLNDQVRDAWGVPESIREIIKQHGS
jgi:hypothetical protein